jgi:hypothetical protein
VRWAARHRLFCWRIAWNPPVGLKGEAAMRSTKRLKRMASRELLVRALVGAGGSLVLVFGVTAGVATVLLTQVIPVLFAVIIAGVVVGAVGGLTLRSRSC